MRDLAQVAHAQAHGRAEPAELTRFCTHCGSLFEASSSTPERPLRGRARERRAHGIRALLAGNGDRRVAAGLRATAD